MLIILTVCLPARSALPCSLVDVDHLVLSRLPLGHPSNDPINTTPHTSNDLIDRPDRRWGCRRVLRLNIDLSMKMGVYFHLPETINRARRAIWVGL